MLVLMQPGCHHEGLNWSAITKPSGVSTAPQPVEQTWLLTSSVCFIGKAHVQHEEKCNHDKVDWKCVKRP